MKVYVSLLLVQKTELLLESSKKKTFGRLPSFGNELIETTNLVQNSYQLLSTPILKKESNSYISPSFVQIKIDEIELNTYIL